MYCAQRARKFAVAIFTVLTVGMAHADPCVPTSVAYDLTHAWPPTIGGFAWNIAPPNGVAIGQTFVATETLISSVKV